MTEQVKYFIGDREVLFNEPTDGQIAAISKLVVLARKDPEKYGVTGAAKILTVIDHMMVSEDDREYVEDLMISGELDLEHLIQVLAAFVPIEKTSAKSPRTRARRGQ